MMRKRLMLILFVALAATAGLGTPAALNSLSPEKRPAYTIVWEAIDYYSDGRVIPNYTETRYVSSTGNWRGVRQYANGKSDETFGEIGRGVFVHRGQKLHFLSEYAAPKPVLSEAQLRNSPNYLRTDKVLGFDAIVVSSGNRPRTCSEFYAVPALGGEVLKTVKCHNELGDKTVLEPISVLLGEPDASLVRSTANLPVDYEHFKQSTQNETVYLNSIRLRA